MLSLTCYVNVYTVIDYGRLTKNLLAVMQKKIVDSFSIFSKVWLLILITMLVMLCAMSLFSKTIMKFYGNTTNDSVATTYHPNEDRTRDHSNSYLMYILSIMTNQGNNYSTTVI